MADLPYVIVPKVPTDEMIAAGTPANQHTEWPAEVVYAEMLDASPPPVSLEEIVEVLAMADDYVLDAVNEQEEKTASREAHPKLHARELARLSKHLEDRQRIRSLLSRLASMEQPK